MEEQNTGSDFKNDMKKALLILTVSIALSSTLFAQKKGIDLNWQSNFELAKKSAEKNKKAILIFFTGGSIKVFR